MGRVTESLQLRRLGLVPGFYPTGVPREQRDALDEADLAAADVDNPDRPSGRDARADVMGEIVNSGVDAEPDVEAVVVPAEDDDTPRGIYE